MGRQNEPDNETLMAVECFCVQYEELHGKRPTNGAVIQRFGLNMQQAYIALRIIYPEPEPERIDLDGTIDLQSPIRMYQHD